MPRGGAARIVELSAEVGDGVKGYSVLRSAITVGSDLLHEVDNGRLSAAFLIRKNALVSASPSEVARKSVT